MRGARLAEAEYSECGVYHFHLRESFPAEHRVVFRDGHLWGSKLHSMQALCDSDSLAGLDIKTSH